MIAGIGSRRSALLLVAFVWGIVGVVPLARPTPTPTPAPAYSPPPREESPFSEPDAFCDRAANRFTGVPPTDPGLRDDPARVVMLLPAATPGGSSAAPDAETFAALINGCGGIGGRRFELHTITETGDPTVDCLAAVSRYHPLVVVSLAASATQRCVVHDQRTIMVTDSDASNAALGESSGRLVATGSSEGVVWARLLDLVDSGRLDGRSVAVVGGSSPSDTEFGRAARAVLATKRIRVVALRRANAVLESTLDIAGIPLLSATTAPIRHHQLLDVYGFSAATPEAVTELSQLDPGDQPHLLQSSNVYAFAPVTDSQYRSSRSPSSFSQMCNEAYAQELAKTVSSSTTTRRSDAPLSASYLETADVCLAMRIVARALFSAGPQLDQTALVSALHRLPYIDSAAPGGTPKARPNQVENEPVSRIEQVVVLTQLRAPCASGASATTTAEASACWTPVSGWDSGGRVVNASLSMSEREVSH